MHIKKLLHLLAAASLIPFLAFGQKTDSSLVYFYHIAADSLAPSNISYSPDTSINGIHNYDGTSFTLNQGNTGRATKSLIFDFNPVVGFYHGINAFDNYRFNLDNSDYFECAQPFSRLFYLQGARKEQLFNITHHQNIYKNFSGTLKFITTKSPGSFTRQKSNNSNFFINLNYQAKNKKYKAFFSYINNVLKIEENGGITSDSLIEKKLETNTKVVPVNLSGAENRVRDNTFQLFQNLKLFKVKDSTTKFSLLSILPLNLQLYNIYSIEAFSYEDQLPFSGYYPYLPSDSNTIIDSTRVKVFRNNFSLTNYQNDDFPFLYRLGIEHQYSEMANTGQSTRIYRDIKPYVSVDIRLPMKFRIYSSIITAFSDDDENYRFDASVNKTFGKLFSLKINYLSSETSPSAFDQVYQSSLFNWNNNFRSLHYNEIGLDLESKIISLGLCKYELNNPVYYLPVTGIPWQSSNLVSGLHTYGKLYLKFGPVRLDQQVHYQKLSNDDIYHIPEIFSRHSLSIETFLFGKALIFHPGVEMTYIQSYYADCYMPATRVFYYQNDKKISDQVYLDFFINLKIKSARIFLKYEHFNSLFSQTGYFTSPSYPAQAAAFKFGIDWVLRK